MERQLLLMCTDPLTHSVDHGLGVFQAFEQLMRASVLGQVFQCIGMTLTIGFNVGDGAHVRAKNNLGVVLKVGRSF